MSTATTVGEVPEEAAFPVLRTASARVVSFDADNAVTLSDPRSAVLVTAGSDLFAVNLEQMLQNEGLLRGSDTGTASGPSGRWTFVCRAPAGSVLLGASGASTYTLLGRPLPGSVIRRVPMAAVQAAVGPDGSPEATTEFVAGLDAGLVTLSEALRTELPPREFTGLERGRTSGAADGTALRVLSDGGWAFVQTGSVRFGEDTELPPLGPGELAFLPGSDWLVAVDDCDVRLLGTADLLASGRLWDVLGRQGLRFLDAIDRRIARRDEMEAEQLDRRARDDERLIDRATSALGAVLDPARSRAALSHVGDDAPALEAMRLVTGQLGLTVVAPPSIAGVGVVDAVEAIARASQLRTRVVRLPAGWWRRDMGPMVGRRRDETPVALLFRRRRYELIDVTDGSVTRIDEEVAQNLSPLASVVYRPLPEGVTGSWRLLRFGLSGCRREVLTFLGCGLFLALLGLFVPVLSGQVLGRFVPRGERSLIVDAGLLVIASAVVAAVFSAVQNLAVLRLEGRISATIQAAVWDHLLELPVRFFGRYAVGDISLAATAVNAVRDALSGVATAAALALFVALANLVLLFVYSVPLALLVVAMVVVSVAVAVVAGHYEIGLQRELFDRQRALSAKVFQLLNGLAKLRVAAAEDRAFAQWAGDFTRVRTLSVRARQIQNTVTVVNTGFALVCSIVIFVFVADVTRISTPAFLSFFAAYSLLLGSLLQFLGVAITVLAVVPLLDSVSPITTSAREVTEDKADPGELSGSVAFDHVTFRYAQDGPPVLDDVSFAIRAGEFVAVVGPTGCGKSTLVRLLLGFERPTSGSVGFDGLDLAGIDLAAVRRQCGVVLQNGALLAGDIKANIIGNGLFTDEDAWEAARLAGFDDDIEAMPMKMYTMLSEGASTLSGGQRQRLMIARALVSRPRIVILDEATSALDNPTQAVVAESTRQLHATRIVIAHRLSTIIHADRIIALDAGRIVQQGTYDELMLDADGMFARLVRRQIA